MVKISGIVLLGMMLLYFTSCGSKVSHKTITVGTDPCPESDFTFELNEDGNSVSITSYTGNREDLVFPKTIQGLPLTKIKGCNNFEKSKNNIVAANYVTSVYIPEGIEEIGEEAFCEFNNLN